MNERFSLFCLILAICGEMLRAADAPGPQSSHTLHVDPVAGDDSGSGRDRPLKSIARAIKLAQPGDTIDLAPATYYESATFSNVHGTAELPIILQGHGAILDGSEPVRSADWEDLGHGLFRNPKLLPKVDPATLGRWYFIWDGKMNHMGRTSKGPKAAFKPVAELEAGEWTYMEDAFYVRVAEGQPLDAANLRYPARQNGVAFGGKGAHITVRDITSTHVCNDGFNIHGAQRALRFENITSIDCGDDGFSAHEDAECSIDGFVSIGNSTGLCDIGSSITHYRNVYIRDCIGFDVFFIGDTDHSMENVWVDSAAVRTLEISQSPSPGQNPQAIPSTVCLKNALFRRNSNKVGEAHVSKRGRVTFEHCTFAAVNLSVDSSPSIELKNCRFSGNPKPAIRIASNSVWKGQANFYSLASLQWGAQNFLENQFADFQRATMSDADSVWSSQAEGGGADEGWLKTLIK